jgi:DNA polymerase III delta subunit
MVEQETNFNNVYEDIITKSFFTERQIYIISKRLINKNKLEDISSGAYYRQLRQCQDKVISLLYSILLLRSLRAVDEQTLSIINGLADQMAVMLSTENRDISQRQSKQSVISVLEQIIKRMSKV